jgi:hypothetical protein
MKQLLSLFLFLLPCLALAQYPSNGNQKITLGEQTTADGLIYRGVLADTGIITPSSDTSAYIILDTVNHRFYNYNRVTNVWSMAGVGSISSGLTGTLPVANGGTGSGTQNFVDLTTAQTVAGLKTFSSAITTSADNTSVFNANTTTTNFKRLVLQNTGGNLAIGIQNSLGSTSFTTQPYASIVFSRSKTDLLLGTNDIIRMTIKDTTGNVGLGVLSPTARLHLTGGTVNPNTAPIKFSSSSLLTIPEAFALETNNNFLFYTNSSSQRFTINHGIRQDATINFPSTSASSSSDENMTVTGAVIGDVVSLGIPNSTILTNVFYMAWVSATDIVTVRLINFSNVSVNPDAATFKVFVTK